MNSVTNDNPRFVLISDPTDTATGRKFVQIVCPCVTIATFLFFDEIS